MLRNWLTAWWRTRPTSRARSARRRLQVEALEPRCLPSTIAAGLGTDHHVYYQKLDPNGLPTTGWFVTPAGSFSQVVSSQDAQGNPVLFGIAADGQVDEVMFNANGDPVTPWFGVAPGRFSQIAAGRDAHGNPELFGISTDNQVYFLQMDAGASPQTYWLLTAPGRFAQVAVAQGQAGEPVAFGISSDSQVYMLRLDAGGTPQTYWTLAAQGVMKQITAARTSAAPEVFGIGADSQVYALSPDPTGNWVLAAPGAVSQISALGGDGGGVAPTLFAVGPDVKAYQLHLSVGGIVQGGWTQMGVGDVTAVSAGRASGGAPELYAVGTDHKLQVQATALPGAAFLSAPGVFLQAAAPLDGNTLAQPPVPAPAAAPLTVALTPVSFVEGPNNNVTVATFTAGNPNAAASLFRATINWGDGSVSTASAATGTIIATGAGTFRVVGSHTYEMASNQGINMRPGPVSPLAPFSVQVQALSAAATTPPAPGQVVNRFGQGPGPTASAATSVPVQVGDAPLTLTVPPPTFVVGPNTNVTVASFTDANPKAAATDFQAVIHWGDGFVSIASGADGTIVANGQGGFDVLGSHTYGGATPGLTLTVQVQDVGPWDNPASFTQVASGGSDGGAYQQETILFTHAVDVAHLSDLVADGGVYDPAVSGPLTSVTYGFNYKIFSNPSPKDGMAVALLIKQGEAYYVSDETVVAKNSGWTPVSGAAALPANKFTLIAGSGPVHPNFSATGAPLEFGYFTAHLCLNYQRFIYGIDNFRVTLNGVTYADATFNNSDWTQIVLKADNLGAAQVTGSAAVAFAPA